MIERKAWTGNHRRLAADMKSAPVAKGKMIFCLIILMSLGYAWYKALVWIVSVIVKYVE